MSKGHDSAHILVLLDRQQLAAKEAEAADAAAKLAAADERAHELTSRYDKVCQPKIIAHIKSAACQSQQCSSNSSFARTEQAQLRSAAGFTSQHTFHHHTELVMLITAFGKSFKFTRFSRSCN